MEDVEDGCSELDRSSEVVHCIHYSPNVLHFLPLPFSFSFSFSSCFFGVTAKCGPQPPNFEGVLPASQPVGFLWTRDQLVAETCTRQNTRQRHPDPWRNSNQQFQEDNSYIPSPENPRLPESASNIFGKIK